MTSTGDIDKTLTKTLLKHEEYRGINLRRLSTQIWLLSVHPMGGRSTAYPLRLEQAGLSAICSTSFPSKLHYMDSIGCYTPSAGSDYVSKLGASWAYCKYLHHGHFQQELSRRGHDCSYVGAGCRVRRKASFIHQKMHCRKTNSLAICLGSNYA